MQSTPWTRLRAWHRVQPDNQRLATVPGIGVLTATAIIGAIGDGRQFRSGRDFAAWVGLVPRQHSTGGKTKLGRISKKGNAYLRRLLVLGATTQLTHGRSTRAPGGLWFDGLTRRKPLPVATVALANKTARIAWAVLTSGMPFQPSICRSKRDACNSVLPLAEHDAVDTHETAARPPAG